MKGSLFYPNDPIPSNSANGIKMVYFPINLNRQYWSAYVLLVNPNEKYKRIIKEQEMVKDKIN